MAVNRKHIADAFNWLKANNKYYADINLPAITDALKKHTTDIADDEGSEVDADSVQYSDEEELDTRRPSMVPNTHREKQLPVQDGVGKCMSILNDLLLRVYELRSIARICFLIFANVIL